MQELLSPIFDKRPLLIAIAGPDGAGKSTFYRSHLEDSDLPFVNADILAVGMQIDPYAAADFADSIRRDLVNQKKSFVFETVFSDPAGEKVSFLKQAVEQGYTVVLFFIGTYAPEISEERVALRVLQGGHDVPTDKLYQRYPRILENLRAAISTLPNVFVLDNSDLRTPYRLLARFESASPVFLNQPLPSWFITVWHDMEN